MLPIQILSYNGLPWKGTEEYQNAFEELKNRLMTVLILCHYHLDHPKQIETDALDSCNAGILPQYEPDNHWYTFDYYNKGFLPAKLNYDLYDKERVVIVNCFEE